MQTSRTLFFLPYFIVDFLSSWYNHLLVLLSYVDLEVSGDFMSAFSIKRFCCSVTKSCPTLWDPMDCSTPGFPVLHYLPKFAQTHVHWISDGIQPSHPLSSPFPPAFNLSQRQSIFPTSHLFTSGGQSIRASASASVLPMNSQDWFPLGLTGWISLQSKGLSRVFSNTTVQKHQFFCVQPSL